MKLGIIGQILITLTIVETRFKHWICLFIHLHVYRQVDIPPSFSLYRVTSQISLHFRSHCSTSLHGVFAWSPCMESLPMPSPWSTSFLFQDGHPPDSLQCWCWEDRHLHHTRCNAGEDPSGRNHMSLLII